MRIRFYTESIPALYNGGNYLIHSHSEEQFHLTLILYGKSVIFKDLTKAACLSYQ